MANEFARRIVDASINETDVALPNGNTTSYSADIDLGSQAYKHENYELEIVVPDLTVTHLPNGETLTVSIVAGSSASPTTNVATIKTFTGAGGAGATGDTIRYRFPSDVARYARVAFAGSTSAGNMSAVDATVGVRF